ncbi:helix-turn-helix domain-containing protein [Lacinutrix sp. Bg11-31]|uniref:helix-turn-helix domain-containing protein n=1 Tax=Lacinutrix sp. Bg11-31 TaxID=2057808 RepID=UPI000C317539|nr:helix-turn-helix domain-containing protein [Lacinutrix sp. Bg11-31]AUC82266.1 DNA-binding protein [Lacinutrix sp. Bg11-31]
MVSKTIQIQEITFEELADKVADKLLIKIKHYLNELHTNGNDAYLTRQETADFLKISLVSLWNWTNKGIVKSYSIGNKRYYNKQEILAILRKNE